MLVASGYDRIDVLTLIRAGASAWAQSALFYLLRANAIAALIAIGISPVLTRLYQPADLGALGVAMTIALLGTAAGGMRYEAGIVAATSPREGAQLAALAITSAVVVSVLVGATTGLAISIDLFGLSILPYWASVLLAASVVTSVAYAASRYWYLHHEAAAKAARGVVTQAVGRATSQTLLGIMAPSASSLILGEAIARMAGLAAMTPATRAMAKYWSKESMSSILMTARRHSDYPRYALPSTVIDSLTTLLPLPGIALVFGLHAAGLYALVQRVSSLPLALVGSAAADALHARFASVQRDRPNELPAYFVGMSIRVLAAAILIAIAAATFGLTVFPSVFGADWRDAGIILAAISPWLAGQLAVSPVSRVIYVVGGQRLKLLYDVLAMLAVLISLGAALVIGLSLLETALVLGITQALSKAAYWYVLRKAVHEVHGTKGPH